MFKKFFLKSKKIKTEIQPSTEELIERGFAPKNGKMKCKSEM